MRAVEILGFQGLTDIGFVVSALNLIVYGMFNIAMGTTRLALREAHYNEPVKLYSSTIVYSFSEDNAPQSRAGPCRALQNSQTQNAAETHTGVGIELCNFDLCTRFLPLLA